MPSHLYLLWCRDLERRETSWGHPSFSRCLFLGHDDFAEQEKTAFGVGATGYFLMERKGSILEELVGFPL